jgi:hypothetical protein
MAMLKDLGFDSLDEFISYYGLENEAVALNFLQAPRFCNMPDKMALSSCKWNRLDVTWTIKGDLPSVQRNDFRSWCDQAWQQWMDVCGIRMHYTEASADITILTRNIDGRNGTLAEAELPCGNQGPLRVWMDNAEVFGFSRGAINPVAVLCHEFGHSLGLSHTNDGGLMDPVYKGNITKPGGRAELALMKQNYGQPDHQPAPAPTPDTLTIKVNGTIEIPGYRVTRLS